MISKHLVRISLIVVGTLLACAPLSRGAEAQRPQGQSQGQQRRGGPEAQLQRMAEELNLTAEQKGKLKTILEKQYKEMQALREDSNLSREDRMAKYRELREKYAPQVKAVLTADQATKWEEAQRQWRERRRNQRSE